MKPSRTTARSQKTVAPTLELSIRGDELEHDRIRLEHNLQYTDLSLHLSSSASVPSDNELDAASSEPESVEFGRHAPPVGGFRSFDDGLDSNSPPHGWSYRTDGDESAAGVHPYGHESLSTAAHHASALTLSAGLGGRGSRRDRGDVSVSGAEYDPERRLQDMIAGIGSKFSALDDASNLKFSNAQAIGFDPLVVDNSVDLDRYLGSGGQGGSPPSLTRIRSPPSSGPTTPTSARTSPAIGRPKLADQLQRTFSPKRPGVGSPRTAPVQLREHVSPGGRLRLSAKQRAQEVEEEEDFMPTPKPRRYKHASSKSQPEVQLQPPTPSNGESTFTRAAHRLGVDIERERDAAAAAALEERNAQRKARHPRAATDASGPRTTKGIARGDKNTAATSGLKTTGDTSMNKSGLKLPDITGLTSAIMTPAKGTREYRRLRESEGVREVEARLITAFNTLQVKLSAIEAENSVSRRRVHELELELEACKQDVIRERTRIMEREEKTVRERRRANQQEADDAEQRYKLVVEEKKALESLISSLRQHLSRLTSELSSHKSLLEDLRTMRERDTREAQEKFAEIERLQAEVERLSGEVEVLRDVAEQGVRERRFVREELSRESAGMDRSDNEEKEEQSMLPTTDPDSLANKTSGADGVVLDSLEGEVGSMRSIQADKLQSPRVNFSPLRSSSPTPSFTSRSTASSKDVSLSVSPETSLAAVRPPQTRPDSRPSMEDSRPKKPAQQRRVRVQEEIEDIEANTAPHTPFPRIRGAQLERLFFSAPDTHDTHSCRNCQRAKAPDSQGAFEDGPTPGWLRNAGTRLSYGGEDKIPAPGLKKGKARAMAYEEDEEAVQLQGEPDPDAYIRVVRELEDDFTHYKSIYMELAEQYALMDAASNVPKRNVLAQHLREVIDCLERKGNQIAVLYDHVSASERRFDAKMPKTSAKAPAPKGTPHPSKAQRTARTPLTTFA